MSEFTDILDELAASLVDTYNKEQLARLVVGYFASVETWEVANHEPAGLTEYHKSVKAKLTGGKP